MAAKTIDEFIEGYPDDIQKILRKIRTIIRKAAPGAEEAIKYGIPTYVLNGRNLVHFSAFKHHIGFYPDPSGIRQFAKELADYKGAKGSVQFPLDRPIPYDLIRRIVELRAKKEEGEKILTKHPQGKSGRSIDKARYDKVAKAIRSALRKGELTHTELMSQVRAALEGRFDGNIGWYAETVKLDLEARQEIERTAAKPQRYRSKRQAKQP